MIIKILINLFAIYGIIALVRSVIYWLAYRKEKRLFVNKLILSIEDPDCNIEGIVRTIDKKYLQAMLLTDGELYVLNNTKNESISIILERLYADSGSSLAGYKIVSKNK